MQSAIRESTWYKNVTKDFIDTTPPAEAIIFPPAPTLIEQILASPADLAALKEALGL